MKTFINSRGGFIVFTALFGLSVYAGVLTGLPH